MNTLEAVAGIVRRCLEAGQRVDIEGLGSFQASPQGFEFIGPTQPNLFVAYAVEDLPVVRRVCQSLEAEGCSPWLDKNKLLPGQNWPRAILRLTQ